MLPSIRFTRMSLGRFRCHQTHHLTSATNKYYLVVHVRAQGVHSLDDRLVNDLRVRVSTLPEHVDLRHHSRHVHARRERVQGDLLLHSVRAYLLSHLYFMGQWTQQQRRWIINNDNSSKKEYRWDERRVGIEIINACDMVNFSTHTMVIIHAITFRLKKLRFHKQHQTKQRLFFASKATSKRSTKQPSHRVKQPRRSNSQNCRHQSHIK